jgi:hypothetical protein
VLLLVVQRCGDKTPDVESGLDKARILGEVVSNSWGPFTVDFFWRMS